MDEFIFMGTRIGCRVLDIVGAERAKASLCLSSGDYKYFVGIGTWLIILAIAGKLIGYFFAPRSAPGKG